MRDHHTHVAALLAVETHAVGRDIRFAADQQGRDDLQQLAPVDRAPVQLEVDERDAAHRERRAHPAQRLLDGGPHEGPVGAQELPLLRVEREGLDHAGEEHARRARPSGQGLHRLGEHVVPAEAAGIVLIEQEREEVTAIAAVAFAPADQGRLALQGHRVGQQPATGLIFSSL